MTTILRRPKEGRTSRKEHFDENFSKVPQLMSEVFANYFVPEMIVKSAKGVFWTHLAVLNGTESSSEME